MTLLSVGGGVAMGQGTGGVGSGGDTSGGHSYVFPVKGTHTYGDPFGARRAGHRHQGQDIMAKCGVRLVAIHTGRVQRRARQSAAGNYLVIDPRGTKQDYAYMHMKKNILVHKGDHVRTGQLLGYVGHSGDATACHLHFENWTSPGWYEGGHPINPIKKLKQWDAYS